MISFLYFALGFIAGIAVLAWWIWLGNAHVKGYD